MFDRIKKACHKIGDAIKDVGEGIKHVGQAIGDGLKGATKMLGAAARLDFKGVAAAATEVVGAITDVAKELVMMTPLAKAANTLLDGKLEKVLDKVDDIVDKAAGAAINGLGNAVEGVKDGVCSVAHGVVTGDLKEIGTGILSAGMGAVQLLPSQIALNAAANVVGSVVGDVIPGKVGDVLGNVASNVVGITHAGEAALTAGVTALGASGALHGVQELIPDQLAPVAAVAGNALMVGAVAGEMAGGRKGNGPGNDTLALPDSHGPANKPSGFDSTPGPQSKPEVRMDGGPATLPQRLELADTGRAEAADLLRKHFSPDQIKDLKLDVRDYFNHGTDVKRQEMQAKWGEQIGGDFNDSNLYKKLLFAVKDVG